MSDNVSIEMLRAQIDQIDDQILDGIIRRNRVVRVIGETKSRDQERIFGFRPGREAEIMRRILARLGNQADPVTIEQIWRAIIGEGLIRQGLVSVSIAPGPAADGVRFFDLARSYFGFGATIQIGPSAGDVRAGLSQVLQNEGVILVAPWPTASGAGQWWSMAIESRFAPLSIVAGWPIRPNMQPEVALIAKSPTDPSGADETWVMGFDDNRALSAALASSDLTGYEVARARSAVLFRILDYVEGSDPRLLRLERAGITGIRILGVRALA